MATAGDARPCRPKQQGSEWRNSYDEVDFGKQRQSAPATSHTKMQEKSKSEREPSEERRSTKGNTDIVPKSSFEDEASDRSIQSLMHDHGTKP